MGRTSEGALILSCVRAHYNSSESTDLSCVDRTKAEWRTVLSTARRHGVVPLVYKSLSRRPTNFPDYAQKELHRDFRKSAANSFLYAAELIRVWSDFEQRGIAAIAFKGPTLAALLYGKLSLRTVRDLDLLVAKEQIQPALDRLHILGYKAVAGVGGAPPSVSSDIRKHILLAHDVYGFAVELHWTISESSFHFPLDFEQLWAERQMVTVMDQQIAALGREHMILMMCAHGTSHCWGSLKWICDIGQAVLAFSDLDWNRVSARARALGCYRMLSVGLALAAEICGMQLPRELESSVRSEKVDQICREVQANLFAAREPVVSIERTLKFVQSRERLLDRIRILLRFIKREFRPSTRDRALVHFPDRLQILYFPFRLVRVILFRWKRAILPILQGAMDRSAPSPPE